MTFVAKGANHVHKYTKLGIDIIADVHQDYAGAAGDKAFLVRICKCGAKRTFEYGETFKMKELLKGLELKNV